jgi:hypothetical protein
MARMLASRGWPFSRASRPLIPDVVLADDHLDRDYAAILE